MKKWEKPKLVILTKGEPEEVVLAACKTDATASGPATRVAGHCGPPRPAYCNGNCSSISTS